MKTTNDPIRLLLEMLDNPEAYTEQQIHDIIHRDETTREAYRLMVDVKRSSRRRHNDKAVDVDAAWKKMKDEKLKMKDERAANFSSFIVHRSSQKIAASFIGVLIASGIAFATVHIVRTVVGRDQKSPAQVEQPATVRPSQAAQASAQSVPADTATVQPVVYDNVLLEKMLTDIAAHYDVSVTFVSDEARQLRFRFVWNPQNDIDQVVSDLNQFERLTVTLNDRQITVE
ncbi:MAG: DUF4974 domain-containing protein [Prevotella sp.]|nr:DUF4974 domain-containing protein [Prevotella sp.]